MFDKMRNEKRQISFELAQEILIGGEYCVLATLSDNGYPYATPLSYIYMDGNIYFHCAAQGQKIRNIDHAQNVCLTVVIDTEIQSGKLTTKYKSVVVFGVASDADKEEKKKALFGLVEKYAPDFLDKGKECIVKTFDTTKIIKIEINHMAGKANV